MSASSSVRIASPPWRRCSASRRSDTSRARAQGQADQAHRVAWVVRCESRSSREHPDNAKRAGPDKTFAYDQARRKSSDGRGSWRNRCKRCRTSAASDSSDVANTSSTRVGQAAGDRRIRLVPSGSIHSAGCQGGKCWARRRRCALYHAGGSDSPGYRVRLDGRRHRPSRPLASSASVC